MKRFIFSLSFLLGISGISLAQNGVVDTHPTATIAIIDPQTGQETYTNSDTAILFKDALIDLVNNTFIVQKQFRHVIGHLGYVIAQTDPSNGNEYQIQQTSKIFGATATVYTFIYNVDQNKLFYDNSQGGDPNLVPQWISQQNMDNLNRCQQYGWFNNLSVPQNNQQQPVADNQPVADSQPVDNEVSTPAPPPALPDYEQPDCPQDGYLWQPGYWAYSVDARGYYWVPGVWVAPPSDGLLWTPAYWAFDGFMFIYHGGYWSNNVGYYGGINYGYGYGGRGYYGGEWREGRFRYNTAVVRVGTNVHNTYINRTVVNATVVKNNSSFNGRGGVIARPSPEELQVAQQPHTKPTPDQIRNQWAARTDKGQFASGNHGGKPMNLATQKAPAGNANTTQPGTLRPGLGNDNNNAHTSPASGNQNTRPGFNGGAVKPNTGNQNTNPGNNNFNARPATGNNSNTNPATGNQNTRPGFNGTETKPAMGNQNAPTGNNGFNARPKAGTSTTRPATGASPNGRPAMGMSIPGGTRAAMPASNGAQGGVTGQPDNQGRRTNPNNNSGQKPKAPAKSDNKPPKDKKDKSN